MKVLAMPNASTFIGHRKYVLFFTHFSCKNSNDMKNDMKYLILAVVMLPLSVMAGGQSPRPYYYKRWQILFKEIATYDNLSACVCQSYHWHTLCYNR